MNVKSLANVQIEDFDLSSSLRLRGFIRSVGNEQALEILELIFDANANSEEGDEAEILSLLIANYENKHYPIDAPDLIEAIKIRMEEMNIKKRLSRNYWLRKQAFNNPE